MTKTTFDLASLDTRAAADKGYELELTHPVTNEALGVFITVLGRDSTVMTEHTRRGVNERLRRNAMRELKNKSAEIPTIEKIEEEGIAILALCTTGWRGVVYQGAELPFSQENAKKLYGDQRWIRSQVDEAISDLGNFIAS